MTYLDDQGYPTLEALDKIKGWPFNNFKEMMRFIKPLWNYSNEGYWSEQETDNDITEYSISTAGWSGNEDLIRAMGENPMFWAMCWQQSRRGGHYIFEVREYERNKASS